VKKAALALVALLAVVSSVLVPAATPVGAAEGDPTLTGYVALSPARIADTRPGRKTIDGRFAGTGAISPTKPLVLDVVNRGGVAAANVAAVSLNVTVTGPTTDGYVTVFPTGETRPTASNVNFDRNQTVANSVIAKVGSGGKVTLHSSAPTHVIVDVAGYYIAGDTYTSVSPARLADTRPGRPTIDGQNAGTGALSPTKQLSLKVTGRGGVAGSGVKAVALNVTVTAPIGDGYVTVYPTGETRPTASNLNFKQGNSVPNLVIAKVGASGSVNVFASSPSAHVIVDVAGYFGSTSNFVPISPARVADSRMRPTVDDDFWGFGPVGANQYWGNQVEIPVVGRAGVPLQYTGAVVLNVTAVETQSGGYATVFPLGSPRPNASNINFAPRATVANLVVAKVGVDGAVSVKVEGNGADLVIDVMGYFPGISSADVAGSYGFLGRDDAGAPLAYDRCTPIPYVINPAGAKAGWVNDVHAAFAEMEVRSGLDFVYLGSTTEPPSPDRQPSDPGRWPQYEYSPILVAFTTPAVIPDLGGSVVGIGGSWRISWAYGMWKDATRWVSGDIYLDRDENLPTGFGEGNALGKVVLHELGHVVGMAHTNNENELMNPIVIPRSGRFGPGDLQGLWFLGRDQQCPPSNAVRTAGGVADPTSTARRAAVPGVAPRAAKTSEADALEDIFG